IALRLHALDGSALSTSYWEERLGPRRMAELAFEEGELLAMRLPARALHLLTVAHSCFQTADDVIGATQVSIRAMIAARHAEWSQAVSAWFDRLLQNFSRLQASHPHFELSLVLAPGGMMVLQSSTGRHE